MTEAIISITPRIGKLGIVLVPHPYIYTSNTIGDHNTWRTHSKERSNQVDNTGKNRMHRLGESRNMVHVERDPFNSSRMGGSRLLWG